MMNIWFDISNSPHINMFYDLILELEKEGHTVTITSRPLANTVALLNQKGLTHEIVGKHYGKNIYKKFFGYPIRVMQLVKFLKKNKPDLAVSQSSFHSPIVARILGIPSIYTNDNEHALGNLPSFFFASRILIPENIAISNVAKNGISKRKVRQYPGLKEGIYLWRKGEEINARKKAFDQENIEIYIRPEPLTAQYYNARHNFLDEMICSLQNKYHITILARDATQLEYYKQDKFSNVNVPEKPLDFETIAINCSLFIGAGGSMTRELAILGIPTISVYQEDLLEVDKYLIEKKLMRHETDITSEKVDDYINICSNKIPESEIMTKGKIAYDMLKTEILKYNKHD